MRSTDLAIRHVESAPDSMSLHRSPPGWQAGVVARGLESAIDSVARRHRWPQFRSRPGVAGLPRVASITR